MQRAQDQCAAPAADLRLAQAHLLAIAHALAPQPAEGDAPAAGAAVRARVEVCLEALTRACAEGAIAEWLRPKLEHVAVVFRRLSDGL